MTLAEKTLDSTEVCAVLTAELQWFRWPLGLLRWRGLGRRHREASLKADLYRLKGVVEAPDRKDFKSADLLALLNVYTAQFGSYTTLLWQVPALGLAAQAFLLTIALGSPISDDARYIASALSIIIAFASGFLMHNQRGRAINQAELAKRLSYKLSLKDFLGGDFKLDDAVLKKANAQDVWAVDHLIYQGWILCMGLFIIADLLVIVSVSTGRMWITSPH